MVSEKKQMPPKVIFIGGMRGVGKSTSLKRIVKKLNAKAPGSVVHVQVGETLQRYSEKMYGKPLLDLDLDQLEQVRTKLYGQVSRKKARVVLLDDHYAYAPRDSSEQVDLIKEKRAQTTVIQPMIKHYLLIESPASEVQRRMQIPGEKPRVFKRHEIVRGIVSQRIAARFAGKETRTPLTIIRNDIGMQDKAIRKIEAIVRRHL